jgi:membrane fusion protein, heavy metal efflux system
MIMINQRYKVFYLLTYLPLICLLVACGNEPTQQAEGQQEAPVADEVFVTHEQAQLIGLAFGGAEQRNLSQYVVANGIVDVPPQNFASVSVPVGGFVQSTTILPGHFVKKGQTLAVLEHPDYVQLQQDYLQAESQAALAVRELDRQKELAEEEVGARRRLQEAENTYRTSQAALQSLEARLNMLGLSGKRIREGHISTRVSLRSPISGYIKTVNLNIGKYVSPTEVLFEVVDKDHMHIELRVFERDIFKIREGQTIYFRVANMDEPEMTARVYLVGQVFDGDSRTILVHGHPEPEREDLIPGLYVNARIETTAQEATVLPEDAVIRQGEEYAIFFKVKDTPEGVVVRRVAVKAGASDKGYRAVTLPANLQQSKLLVLAGAWHLDAEMTKEE